MDAIAFACVDCDMWVGTTPIQAQAHTDEIGTTQEEADMGRDMHDSFYVVNTSEGA